MSYEVRKAQVLKLVEGDNYLKAFDKGCNLLYNNPSDFELLELCMFLFDRIVEANYDFEPETAVQYHFRGLSKFYKDEVEASIVDFDKALSINPKMDYVLKCKAFSYTAMRQYKKAIELLNRAIAIRQAGEYYDDLAENFSKLGDIQSTLTNHEKAVKSSPNDARLWYNFGTHLGKYGYIEAAIEKFDEAIRLWPQYPDALHNREYYLKKLSGKTS